MDSIKHPYLNVLYVYLSIIYDLITIINHISFIVFNVPSGVVTMSGISAIVVEFILGAKNFS